MQWTLLATNTLYGDTNQSFDKIQMEFSLETHLQIIKKSGDLWHWGYPFTKDELLGLKAMLHESLDYSLYEALRERLERDS